MIQEEKELLLKDLCARLPYGVKIELMPVTRGKCTTLTPVILHDYFISDDVNYLPYLRPMESMTEEELDELIDCEDIDFDGKSELVKRAMLAFAEGDKLLSNALFSMQYAKLETILLLVA